MSTVTWKDETVSRLRMSAAVLDDLEGLRIANGNRLSIMTRTGLDADGLQRGAGLPASHPSVKLLTAIVDHLGLVERIAEAELVKALKAHPLHPWLRDQRGVGPKQSARLLAAIGDPYIRPQMLNEDGSERTPEGPRTVSALWAYCGLHVLPEGAAAKLRRGVKANWSTIARMRVHLIAESCVKQLVKPCYTDATDKITRHGYERSPLGAEAHWECKCSPYRVVYDERKEYTRANRPDWTDGHRHNDALRVAGKRMLRDLWRAARDLHEKDLADKGEIDG